MNKLAVMQGRLLPKYRGRYQAFPADNWQKEFQLAKELEFDCIEFIFDHFSVNKNPFSTKEGVQSLRRIIEKTGVEVKTICADYFMDAPFHNVTAQKQKESIHVLRSLIYHSSFVGVENIIIPCVDQSSLQRNKEYIDQFVLAIRKVLDDTKRSKLNLSIEADLPPKELLGMIKEINSEQVTVNYDTGDSRYLGYDPIEEIETYGKYISTIHIKDRPFQKTSTILGQGDVDFDQIFTLFNKLGFQGVITMQPFRDEEGLKLFKQQYQWIKPRLTKYFGFQFREAVDAVRS